LTEELAEKRGRRFYLAARVATSLEMCDRIGYDVRTWVEEGLVDILIPGGGAATDPAPDVAGFVELCKGRDIAVYPGFDGGLPDPYVGPESPEIKDRLRTRAIARRHFWAGADGIYAFNWHANRDSRRELLCQVGSAETLRGIDKIYAATHRFRQLEGAWRGAYQIDRVRGQVPVPLKKTFTGAGPVVDLEIAENFEVDKPKSVELRVRLDQWVRGDEVQVRWDGVELEEPEMRYCSISDPNRIADVTGAVWVCFALEPEGVPPGNHQVEVALVRRHPQLACDLVLTDVELVVCYP